MNGWMDGWMDLDGWMWRDGWMDGWMARWLTLWSRSLTVSQLRDKVGLKGGKNGARRTCLSRFCG